MKFINLFFIFLQLFLFSNVFGRSAIDFWEKPRTISLYRDATREHAVITFYKDGQYINSEIYKASYLLRDVKDNETVLMDINLLNILRGIQGYFENQNKFITIHITSGYRTKKNNDKLKSEGAAQNSMHLYGKAADIYIPNVSIQELKQLALYFKSGGVGVYASKGFVHIDSWKFRFWADSSKSKKKK